MLNIKALALTVQKLLARLKTEWQNYRITDLQNDRQDKNNMPPIFDLGGIEIQYFFWTFWDYTKVQFKSKCMQTGFQNRTRTGVDWLLEQDTK